MLVAAKRLGFSLHEVAQFNVDEIANLIDVSLPESAAKPAKRMATQKEIDWFLG